MPFLLSTAIFVAAQTLSADPSRDFVVESADGTRITGTADLPDSEPRAVVVMVAGSGLFDRDVRLGQSNTPRDLLFRDLAGRFVRRGLAGVRYDRRGVNFGSAGPQMLDATTSATLTARTQTDDLRAVYDWARTPAGLNARCVILFGHSEGVQHIAALAEAGDGPPALVIGVGAPMRSPVEVLRWQMAERDAYSIERMDENQDGRTTTAEVDRNWRRTPSSAFDRVEPLRHPSGAWTASDLQTVRNAQAQLYEQQKRAALALDDAAPYPDGRAPIASASWWKSWFTDDSPVGSRLARWNVPVRLHYGDTDSQTPPHREAAAAEAYLGNRVTVTIHQGRGHSLGEHALLGPMDEVIADRIADEAARAAEQCR